jgi:hypothetical protein
MASSLINGWSVVLTYPLNYLILGQKHRIWSLNTAGEREKAKGESPTPQYLNT